MSNFDGWEAEIPPIFGLKEEKLWREEALSMTVLDLKSNPTMHLMGEYDSIFESELYPTTFEFNEEVARVFDDMVTRSVPMYREAIDNLMYWVNRFYQPESTIYDLGCSTGTTIDVLAQTLNSGANFIGVDISRPMVKRAKAKLQWATEKHSVNIIQEDLTMTDVHDASIVIMNYTLQFIPMDQRARLLRRIFLGLKPGGIFFIGEKVKSNSAIMQDTTTWIYEDFKSRAGYSKTEITKKKDALQGVLVPITDADLQDMIARAGFECSEVVLKFNNFSTIVAYKSISTPNPKSNTTEYLKSELSAEPQSLASPGVVVSVSPLDSFYEDDPDYLYTILKHEQVQSLNVARRNYYLEKRPRFDSLNSVAAKLRSIPAFRSVRVVTNDAVLQIGDATEMSPEHLDTFQSCLTELMPWKKGPLSLFGTAIDTEWRSDFKWERIQPHISSLAGKVVADVGCANGYFMFRMLEQNPKLVMGLDPNIKAWMEFQLLKYFSGRRVLQFEVLTVDHLDLMPQCFDTIFCLGVLYHGTDPIGMLRKLYQALKPGGEIVIDCQGVDEDSDHTPVALFPRKTYAGAKGIWFLPSRTCLLNWLARTQFQDVHCFYDEPLSQDEQRSTEWAPINSLRESLSPVDGSKTVEGYPAPRRIYMTAKRQ